MAKFPPPQVFLRAKTLTSVVALATGEIYRIPGLFLKQPVTFAKTGGAANLSVNSATGAVSATAALTSGQTQSLAGTATGADGVVVPLTVNLTGANVVAQPVFSISSGNKIQSEGNSGTTAFVYTIARSVSVAGAATVHLTVTNGGTNLADFGGVDQSGTISFADGEASKNYTVFVSGDTDVEGDESFTVSLDSPSIGTIGSPSSATGTILNDDTAPGSFQRLGVNLNDPGFGRADPLQPLRGNEYPQGAGVDEMRSDFAGVYSDGKYGILAWPNGVTQSYMQIAYNLVPGTSARYAVTAEGAGTPGSGGIFALNNAGGQISNIAYSGAGQPLRVEFDFQTPPGGGASGHFLVINKNGGWSAADPIRNIQCRAIGPAAGAATMTNAAPINPGTWNSGYVQKLSDNGYANVVRFMDFQQANYGTCSSLTGQSEWPGVGKRHSTNQSAYVMAGSGNSGLTCLALGYAGANGGNGGLMQQQYADNLPYHAFGSAGNRLSLTIVAGSGALAVSFNKTNGEFTVTLASGGNTADQVIAALQAYDPFRCMLLAQRSPGSNGSGAVAPMARTYFHGGGDIITDGENLKQAVELTNQLQANAPTIPWLFIPWHASAQHATDWANWVKDNLSPACPKIFVEVGNEVWNFGLPTYQHINAWGSFNGRTGTLWEQGKKEYAASMIRIGNALKAVLGSRVEVIAGNQLGDNNTAQLWYETPGFLDAVDAIAAAPYFVPYSVNFAGEANDIAWAQDAVSRSDGIGPRVLAAYSSKQHAASYGMGFHIYEFGQHDVSPYSDDYVRRQRSPLMKKLMGMYLSECHRLVGVGDTVVAAYYMMVSSIAGGISGAWGLQENMFATRAESPKFDAYLDAMVGVYPAYIDTTEGNIKVTGHRGDGQQLFVRIPAIFNAASASLKIYRDGVVSSTVPITVQSTAQTYTYTQTSADTGTEIKFEITLVGTDGNANFLPYVTPPVPDVWYELDAIYAWNSIADTDTDAVNPDIGGALSLISGTTAAARGSDGLWDFNAAAGYSAGLGLTRNIQQVDPVFMAFTLDLDDNPASPFTKVLQVGNSYWLQLFFQSSNLYFRWYAGNGSIQANFNFPMTAGRKTYWAYHPGGAVGSSVTVTIGQGQTVLGTATLGLSASYMERTVMLGDDGNHRNSMKYGPITVVNRAGMTLADAKFAVSRMDAIPAPGDTTAPTITSANAVSVAENAPLAFSLTANESVTWSLFGGADVALFELSGSTLRWVGNGTKDYEAPNDAGTNNVYDVIVRATDGAGNTTNQAIAVTVTDVAESSVFTMTQLASANRVYQRDTETGGTQNKGQGTIPVGINATVLGPVYARRRRISDNAILQAAWLAGNITTTGSQTLNVSGVDAGPGQFALDLSGDGVTWINGTVAVAMGGLIFEFGQSHISAQFIRNGGAGDSSTITGNGLTVPADMRIFVAVDSGNSNIATSWLQPSDGGSYNSTGSVELASRLIAQLGIPIGIVSKCQGGTRLDEWLPGQTYGNGVAPTIAAAGGKCEAVILGIGHNDAQYNVTAYDAILSNLTAFWNNVDTALGGAGNYKKLMFGVPNLTNDAYNTDKYSRMKVNGAYEDWAAANNATFLPVQDIPLGADHVHPTQAGNIRYARHFYRGLCSAFGLSGDDRGPKITGISKSGLNLSLPVNHQSGATALAAQGNPASRFWIARRGFSTALALDGVTPLTVNAAELLFKLASDPGAVPIEVLPFALHPVDDGSADMIYDNHVDGDGIAQGRALYASPWGFDTRPKGDLTVTSPTYGNTAFGGGLSAGWAASPFPVLPSVGNGVTIDIVYKHLATDATSRNICAQLGDFWLNVLNGNLVLTNATITVGFVVGQTYRISLVSLPGGKKTLVFINGTLVYTATSALSAGSNTNNFTIRQWPGGQYPMGAGGEVGQVAIFRGARYLSAFTPSADEYVGDEPNQLHLWKFKGSGADAII